MYQHFILRSLIYCSLLAADFCHGDTQTSNVAANFKITGNISSGSSILTPSNEGVYVYGKVEFDGRIPSKALIVSRPIRTDYVLLSAQEESDLWHYKQIQSNAQQEELERLAKIDKQTKANLKYQSIKWPKVMVKNDKVCVPLLNFSESKEWKSHLTCTDLVRTPSTNAGSISQVGPEISLEPKGRNN
jgi:hypothetical protein